jgi:Flp pilus assembly protein TadG
VIRRLRRFLRCGRGATAVEFALVATPFLLLVVGGLEFGRVEWTRQGLQQTAIQGARCMGLLQSDCAASGAYSAGGTQDYLSGVGAHWGLSLTPANMSLNRSATCAGVAGFSSVNLTYTFDSVVPGLVQMLGSKTMTASACFPNNS